MYWSVFQRQRDAILPGEQFRLRLNLRPFPLAAVEVAGRKLEMSDRLELAAASLWLLLRLGGVGARAPLWRGNARGRRAGRLANEFASLGQCRHEPGRRCRGTERGRPAGAPGSGLAGATACGPVFVRHPARARLSTLPR